MRLSGVPVLMYHGLTTSPAPVAPARERKYWITVARFQGHLEVIRAGRYRVMTLAEVWKGGDSEDRPVVALTFDDGRLSDYALAFPALVESGLRAEFFLNTAMIGKPGWLDWPQILEMQRAGMSFQSHGHDHVDLTRLAPRALARQLRHSRERLEERLGSRVEFLAVPYGQVNGRVVEAARAEGYRAVCTSLDWPARPGAVRLGRVVVYRDTAPLEFARLLSRRPAPYLARRARAAVIGLPKRLLLWVRPRALGVRVAEDAA